MEEKILLQTLVIEDDPFFVAVLTHYGETLPSFQLKINHTSNLEDTLHFLDAHPEIQLIFLDYLLHDKLTGLEILQHIRARGIKVPVIVVTGRGTEEVAVSMMKAGASDYLIKGALSVEVLEASIKDSLVQYERFKGFIDKEKEFILKDMAIKTSLNGVCMMDLNGMVTYVNPSFVTMWGYTDDSKIIGKNVREIFLQPEHFDDIFSALKTKKSWLGELSALKRDGTRLYLQSLFSLINAKAEANQEIMSSFIDITRLKEAETKREALYKGIMEVFALRAEEVGNVETAGHIHRIAAYTGFIAAKLKEVDYFRDYIDEKYINDISYASMLHDVGKWRTPNEILLKPSELTPAEREIIRQHPRLGVEMLMPLLREKGSNQYLKLVESVVLYHHERWDGTGYPESLKGEEIPLSARIVTLADIYDALTSSRSYRKALSHEEAYEIMAKDKEAFDPRIWKIFLDNQDEFKRIRNAIA